MQSVLRWAENPADRPTVSAMPRQASLASTAPAVGKHVKEGKEFWICIARPIKQIAEQAGYAKTIEASGAKFACDTCMVVAPIKGRFKCLATDSAKSCFYARGKNAFKTKFGTLEECVAAAVTGEWKAKQAKQAKPAQPKKTETAAE